MATFAKIGLDGEVMEIHSVVNEVLHDSNGVEQEKLGINFLTELTNWPIWKQTSYNTRGGVHLLGGTPFRKNHASIGGKYDSDRDAFLPPKTYKSWVLDEETCLWEAPVALPDTENRYTWNEETTQWDLIVSNK